MPDNFENPPVDVWRDLYRLATTLARMEPWEWMPNGIGFALRMKPGSEATRVMAVMKMPNRFPVITMLDDWRCAYLLSRAGGDALFYDPVNISQTNVLFSPESILEPVDRSVMSALGIEPAKEGNPFFRTLRDGHLPRPLSRAEAEEFRDALNQTLGIALRSEENPDMLDARRSGGILARVRDASGAWSDIRVEPPPPPPPTLFQKPAENKIEALRGATKNLGVLQAAMRLTKIVVSSAQTGQCPSYHFLMTAPDGHVFISALIVPGNGIMMMWRSIVDIFIDSCMKIGAFPSEIQVADPRLQAVLHPLTELVHFRLTRVEKLEAVDRVAESALRKVLPHLPGAPRQG